MDLAYPLEVLIGFEFLLNTEKLVSKVEIPCGPVTVRVEVIRVRYKTQVIVVDLVFGEKYKHLSVGDLPIAVRFFRGDDICAERSFRHATACYRTCPANWRLSFAPV